MGTIATNLLPNATGLDLGSPSQRFDVFAKTLTADSLTTNTANPATSGAINLASTEAIAWRNAANNADVLLAKSQAAGALPADTLTWPNGIQAAEYITATINPASVGVLRLAKTDTVDFRNNANSGDITALSLNGDDSVQVGDVAGIKAQAITTTGAFSAASIVSTGGSFSSPATVNLSSANGATGGSVNVTAGDGSAGNGGLVTITGGNSATSAVGGAVVLVPGTGVSGQAACVLNGTVTVSNTIASYNGSPTAGNGAAVVMASTSQRTENAADTNLLTLTPPALAGSYRMSIVISVSAQNTATLGWTATWKDANGVAQSPTNLSMFGLGVAAPALTFVVGTGGSYFGSAYFDIDNSSTPIIMKLTFTGTSFTAKVSANIERIV